MMSNSACLSVFLSGLPIRLDVTPVGIGLLHLARGLGAHAHRATSVELHHRSALWALSGTHFAAALCPVRAMAFATAFLAV